MNLYEQSFVHPTAVIGAPFRPLQGFVQSEIKVSADVSFLGKHYVGPYCIVYAGAEIGDAVILDEYVRVGRAAKIGSGSLVTHRGSIGGGASIGANCVIGGLISENCVVEDNVKFFGKAIHSQSEPSASWDHAEPEPSALIRENSFVAFDSLVIGGVVVGPNAYIAAGAIVTRDVPEKCIVVGDNQVVAAEKWNGRLRHSKMFS